MEDGGDQSFVDAAQLTVDHTLQDGAEASPFGYNFWVLQGYRRSKSLTVIFEAFFSITICKFSKVFLSSIIAPSIGLLTKPLWLFYSTVQKLKLKCFTGGHCTAESDGN